MSANSSELNQGVFEPLLTDKEFCERLKIDRATSLRWRKKGMVGFIKLPNGDIRYYERDLLDMLQKNRREKKVA